MAAECVVIGGSFPLFDAHAQSGNDLRTLQERLGGKGVSTTMIYIHAAERRRRKIFSLLEAG
jgi:site-specific recombinase XerC